MNYLFLNEKFKLIEARGDIKIDDLIKIVLNLNYTFQLVMRARDVAE